MKCLKPLVCSFVVLAAAQPSFADGRQAEPRYHAASQRGVEGRYLVTLAPGEARWRGGNRPRAPRVDQVAAELAGRYGGTVGRVFEDALPGFEIALEEARARELARDPAVAIVEQDRVLVTLGELPVSCYEIIGARGVEPSAATVATAVQAIECDDPDPRNPSRNCVDNWGLDRIDQTSAVRNGSYTYTAVGTGINVYTIDTGINADHSEFQEFGPPWTRVRPGHNVIVGNTSDADEDCHGHGTHVAAIVGGGVSGVAKDVWLHPIKFFDTCSSSNQGGQLSDAVVGINWVAQNHQPINGRAIVNFSGGNVSTGLPSLVESVKNLLGQGISFVQSAGNQDQNGCSLSVGGYRSTNAALVVGATDSNFVSGQWKDGRWRREGPATTGGAPDPSYASLCASTIHDCGSNFGGCLDLFAPGAHIVSADTEDLGGVCRLSGTSMAAPHVTGAAALYLKANPTATPLQVHNAIVLGATCGALETNPASPYYIGAGSPNLLLNVNLNGGGPLGCD